MERTAAEAPPEPPRPEAGFLYAGFWRRVGAALLDNLVWLIGIGWLLGSLPSDFASDEPVAAGILFAVLASLWFNYFAVCEWRFGQTIGKNAAGIRVTTLDGGRPSFGQASLRNVLRLVDVVVIGWVLIASDRRRQRLGDKAAGTVVVPRPPRRSERIEPRELPGARLAAAPPPDPATIVPPPPPPVPTVDGAGTGRHRLPAISWTTGETVGWLFGGLFVAFLIAPALVLPFDPDFESTGALLAAQGLLVASLVTVAVGVASRWRWSGVRDGLRRLGLRRFRASALGWMLLALFGYYLAAGLFATYVVTPEQEDIGGELGIGDESVAIAVAAVLLIAVIQPTVEELFFRGFVFGGLRAQMPLWGAIVVSGLLFGLIHAPTGITTVVPLAILGGVLAWLYDWTGSLWPCVFAHMINNSLALAVTA